MERYIFGRKTISNRLARVDRFVMSRDGLHTLHRKHSWPDHFDLNKDHDIWDMKHIRQKKYVKYLDDAFGIEPSTPAPKADERRPEWPCVPRKKGYLSSADSMLDLPTYSYAVFPELLDWSNDNILVAALGRHYYKWSWRIQSLISEGLAEFPIQCCKFNPRGDLLALGTEAQFLEVHDSGQNKRMSYGFCKCSKKRRNLCSITALDWSPTGNSFSSGCSWGTVASYTSDAQNISWRVNDTEPVLAVRVSPDARYLATTSFNCAVVYLLTWPSLQLHHVLKADRTVQTLAWHPWRSALLGVGTVNDDMQPRLVLWDPTCKVRETTLVRRRYSLDAMLFSPLSGELVVSLFKIERSQPNSAHLLVLSDPDTVVDQWGDDRHRLDRVRTMVFSPDGTKLATATADEDLIIWNFLPEEFMRKKVRCKRFSAFPVFLDEATHGMSLR